MTRDLICYKKSQQVWHKASNYMTIIKEMKKIKINLRMSLLRIV